MPDPLHLAPTRPAGVPDVPLCVDLDGTLIHSDLLWESLALLLREHPLAAFLVPIWLLRGRAHLKRELARRVTIDATTLPYNTAFLDHLRAEKRRGRRLALVTASDALLARQVADHLQIFDDVIGSDGRINLRSESKATALTTRFGARGFDYAGDAPADFPVWAAARATVLVGASAPVVRHARAQFTVAAEFPRSRGRRSALADLLRPHQWVKNLIVLVPLITAHQIADPAIAQLGALAFLAFCCCASAVYVLNDFLDCEADRAHPAKRRRPFASGRLPLGWALWLTPLLLAAGFAIAATLPGWFRIVLAVYVVASFAYSWRLKQVAMLDVFVLASLYTLRLLAGHTATGVAFSDWLLAFSMFVFVSLALVKRVQELRAVPPAAGERLRGRGYVAEDRALLTTFGAASGYLAVLVLAIYVTSDQVRRLYHHPALLLLICPLFLYWISRTWLIAHRGEMADDPVVFALKDGRSYVVGVLALFIVWLAT